MAINNALDTATTPITIPLSSNQLILGTTNTITISSTAPTASRILTIPDPGADASFVISQLDQKIYGNKAFGINTSGTVLGKSLISIGGGMNSAGVNGVNQVEFQHYNGNERHFIQTWHNAAANSNLNRVRFFLENTTDPTASTAPGTGNALAFEITGTDIRIPYTANQIILGTSNTTTINASAPAASRTYTLPDVLANASFVMTEGTQTINGAKTFSSAIGVGGGANNILIGANTPSATRTYTMPDVSANAFFVLTEGTQTINGAKTFGGTVTFNSTIAGLGNNIDVAVNTDFRISSGGKIGLNGSDEAYFLQKASGSNTVRLQGFDGVTISTGLGTSADGGIHLASTWGPRVFIGGVTGGIATAQDRLEVLGGVKLGTAIGNGTGSPGVMIDGTIQWNGTNFQGRKNGAWTNLDGANPYIDTYAVDLATTANVSMTYSNGSSGANATLTSTTTGILSIDGVATSLGTRVLFKDQTTAAQNGVYVCTVAGATGVAAVFTRVIGFDLATNWINNKFANIYVASGTVNGGTYWRVIAPPATVGTDAINFIPFNDRAVNIVQPNIVIGGNFDTNPWQRGTDFPVITGGTMLTADRFPVTANNVAVEVEKISNDTPTVAQVGIKGTYSFKLTVSSSSTQAASDYLFVGYRIEGYDWAQISQKYFTISFWVKASVTGTYSLSCGNTGFDNGYCTTYTINTANTWEYKAIYIKPSTTSGTWDYQNDIGCAIRWYIMAGSNLQTSTLNTWQSSGYFAANTQTNGAATNGNTFFLDFIKIEPGYGATRYPVELKEDVLLRCKRYCQSSYEEGIGPGYFPYPANSVEFCCGGPAGGIPNGTVLGSVRLETMRSTPIVQIYSPATGTSAKVQDVSKLPTVTDYTISVVDAGTNGFKVANNSGSVLTSGDNYSFHYLADAEL